jgi:hypothetical protein
MPATAVKLLLVSAALSCVAARLLPAQNRGVAPDPPCDGKRVTRVDIRPGRPPFEGTSSRWRNVARALGLHHATTRPGVIDAFLALDEGEPCSEVRRAESERVLRAQPFIATASVRAIPDGPDGVRVLVETTDEIPVLVAAQFRGLVPRAGSLGSSNVAGEGLLVQANFERGYAYRTGFGARIVDYAAFGRPFMATLEGERYTVGRRMNAMLEHPFYTDLQRIGWHTGYLFADDYPRLRRPVRSEVALHTRQWRWDVSSIARVFGTRTVGLVGLGASGLRLTPDSTGIVVTDTGFAADQESVLRNRYAAFRSTRIGVIGGVRRVTFQTVRGFDALTAQQDVGNGAAAGVYVAKGIPQFGGEDDLFLSGIGYAGIGGERHLLGTLWQVEGRRGQGVGQWDSVIGSGRTAIYFGGGPGIVFVADDQFSGGSRSLLPLQLALGDFQGGMIGYGASSLAGARRNIARVELRWSGEAVVRNADVGFATFGQVGSVWAGDAPYGSTATRAAVGVSLLAAYPTHSKRLYHADLGIPLARTGEGGGKIELRFWSEDRTDFFWREPGDVSRARTGVVPTSLFAFPTR